MKGLISQNMQTEKAAPEQEAPAQGGEGSVTEAEQQEYEQVVLAATEVLHDDQTNPGIMNMLKAQQDDPAAAMSDVVTTVMLQLDEQSGGQIPEDVILPASEEVLVMVAELAHAAKLFTPDQRSLNLAMQQTITKLGEHYGISPEDVQELIDQMDPEEVKKMVAEQQSYSAGA